jgi:hypothetical protein
MTSAAPTTESWKQVIKSAYRIFDDLEAKGFGEPPFSLGGGTVLMLRFRHRLSKDIGWFGYDAQWLSLLTPRLNETAAGIAQDYAEQANAIKITTAQGDIDFIIAADVARPVNREVRVVEGRELEVDPTDEILAKKLFYRAAALKARDVYDLSAVIDLDADAARKAAAAAEPRKQQILHRLRALAAYDKRELINAIIPFDGALAHADGMVDKVYDFIAAETGEPKSAK